MLSILKLIWINTGIYISLLSWTGLSIIISPVCYLFFTKILRREKPETLRKMIWYYGWTCSRLMSLFVDIKWPEQKELPSPCIIVANHESFFDPYLVSFQPDQNICMAVRNWPFKIPFYGFYMRLAGYINVESDDLDNIKNQATKALAENASLMFFPEGTRSRDGSLGRFHSGPFHIAMETGIPIVPLCISGSYKLLPRESMILRPSKVRGLILDPVYPDKYKDKQNAHIELRRAVKEIMVAGIENLKKDEWK
ncbi:lysophospholipid acyltransferase family protein [Maridesulfovibrio hydrothermalis]|uniref:Putative Phospholipid/glycerol acyltransferase n=1 Tax=Maridesulfovibrio hydrothermalis AM13 = DSM 14728 TaxID=1121451 RepID=L0RB45_9BACT|nr:lysophospholipid acyltransferase family protein [Maridesulfovibrio hydrothermalis]CCO23432.1 putative Phospholipid/glycerol acyltransferase [Maridesulfovibrio hydrothermalis AM13 = DSM 14728]